MSTPSGPGSRVPIPKKRLRLSRRRAARRRGFAAFLGVVVVVIAALGWAATRDGNERAATGPSGATSPAPGASGGTGNGASPSPGGVTIVPGEAPIAA